MKSLDIVSITSLIVVMVLRITKIDVMKSSTRKREHNLRMFVIPRTIITIKSSGNSIVSKSDCLVDDEVIQYNCK